MLICLIEGRKTPPPPPPLSLSLSLSLSFSLSFFFFLFFRGGGGERPLCPPLVPKNYIHIIQKMIRLFNVLKRIHTTTGKRIIGCLSLFLIAIHVNLCEKKKKKKKNTEIFSSSHVFNKDI